MKAAAVFLKQLKDSGISNLSFDERFGLLVDVECTMRKNNRLKRLMKSADYAFPGASRILNITSPASSTRP